VLAAAEVADPVQALVVDLLDALDPSMKRGNSSNWVHPL
jgi:hypothetical protein